MCKYTAVNGTTFTDEDIETWAAEAASEQGYTGGHTTPSDLLRGLIDSL